MQTWTCHLCNDTFTGKYRRSAHMRNVWKRADDPSRCDNINNRRVFAPPIIATPVITEAVAVPEAHVPVAVEAVVALPVPDPVGVATACATTTEMARRKMADPDERVDTRMAYCISRASCNLRNFPRARDLTVLQTDWSRYLEDVHTTCSDEFWKLFLRLHTFSGTAIDTTLSGVRKLFLEAGSKSWKDFPPSRRALLQRMDKVDSFWPKVLHSKRIDLSAFALPSGTRHVTFQFVDPLWGWLMAARRPHPLDMHWKPFAQNRQNPVYGGGVEYGTCFSEACEGCPRGTYPMCVCLHWDGTSARGLSSDPICIGVGNTNICGPETQFCLGYMPHIPDTKRPEFKKTTKSTDVKFYIRQQCATAILRVLESAARTGVKCRLLNIKDDEVDRVLFPKLVAMNFDQPEAQLFFGLQNKSSCSKCKWRKGYSAFRKGSLIEGTAVRRLYAIANGDDDAQVTKQAREKLRRWGLNYKRRCCIMDVGPELLVRLPGTDELYPCLDYRDTMHGLCIYCHRCVLETLNGITIPPVVKRLMDMRLAVICGYRCFRDPTGRAYRKQHSVFKDVGMTAVDKVCYLFLLAHVLGPTADIIPDARMREPLLTAIAYAQLMILASRGLRSYTEPELKEIYDNGNLKFHKALETIRFLEYNNRVAVYDDSTDEPPPKRFKRTSR